MPEFQLDLGTCKATDIFCSLDEFTRAYIECAYWTSTGTGDDEDLEHATFAEMERDTLQAIIADCARFQADNAQLLERACSDTTIRVNRNPNRYGGYESAGHDFWLTRNGHGAGFWDGDWGQHGDALTSAAKSFRELYLYRGDDGLIYIS